MPQRTGIIGGTGFSLPDAQHLDVDTPWGAVEVAHAGDVLFVQRHGARHVPPHRVAHRANVDALARCGVDAVFALNAVGALDAALAVPSLLVPDDLLDLRKSTETFHDARAVHVDLSEPYCPALRALLVREAATTDGGTYVAVEGPRLETRAEVRMMRAMG
ncbi:MAG TPA: S-methyl-5'-thioadenosine phosphorylase, partial [Candidatus Thermoplasmatota archaeon]|nr:S-methyl-5'-thioadenosine phosphorylase [Candidatus Thermoplasmatota archaeon]